MYQDLKRELDEFSPLAEGDELTMTLVLKLPDNLRAFLTWMMRQKIVQPETVAKYIEQDFFTTLGFLGQMVKKGLIEEAGQTHDNEKQFTVSVRSSRNFRVPDKIWKVFDE
jgi:hypothetical protein